MTNGPIPPADWYPDPHAPAGHLRYWDGSAWTEHRAVPTPVAVPEVQSVRPLASPSAPKAISETKPSWITRHKIISSLIALGLVAWSVDAVSADDQPPSDSESSSSTNGDDSSSSTQDEDEDDSANSSDSDEAKPKTRTYRVVRVVDGDTVTLGNGDTVRLGGIDAPEVGECGYKRARNKLSELVLGKQVSLGATDEDHDQYGRLLRYVDVDGTDSGLRLIKDGLSIARYDSRDGYGFHPREPAYIKADQASKAYICAKPVPLVAQPKPKTNKNCAPGYSPCIPPYPPDLNCPDIGHPVTVTGSDPHGLDRDGDGIACEWS